MHKLIALLFWYLVGMANFCSSEDLSSENDEPSSKLNQFPSSDTKPPIEGERIPDIGPQSKGNLALRIG